MLPIAAASADTHMKFPHAQPSSPRMRLFAVDEQDMWRCRGNEDFRLGLMALKTLSKSCLSVFYEWISYHTLLSKSRLPMAKEGPKPRFSLL